MKLAVIADIHGNAPALEAVLSELSKDTFNFIVNLGDSFNGPIDPSGVAKLLRSVNMIHIQGNGERMVLSQDHDVCTGSAEFARKRLDPNDLNWIASWPETYQNAEFFACHGTPDSDIEYLVESPLAVGGRLKLPGEMEPYISEINNDLILCAHSHVPRWVKVNDLQWILNPGSVGLPAYALSSPFPHKMETGSPCARYAIAEKSGNGWRVCHFSIPYEYERAANAAEQQGYDAWATEIRTGYAT